MAKRDEELGFEALLRAAMRTPPVKPPRKQ